MHTTSPSTPFERPLGLGGTDIAAILGLSPYKSPLEVWSQLVGERNPQNKDMLHLRFGQHAESFIANEYERCTRLKTHAHPQTIFHPEHNFMFGHVDRLVSEPGQDATDTNGHITTNRILECKTASAFNRSEWGDEGTDQIPATYLMQCAWYLAITRCQFVDVAVLVGNNDFRIYHVERDLELEGLLIEHALKFWHEHVVLKTPPRPTTPNDAALLFPNHVQDSQVEANPELLASYEKYRDLIAQSQTINVECDRLKTEILSYMGQAERLTFGDKTLATWKCAKTSQRVDTKSLCAAHPEIASQFTQQVIGSRRFLLKDAT